MYSPVKIWRNQKTIAAFVGKKGVIESWTMVRVPLGTFSHLAPYPVAIVALDTGERMCLQVVDWGQKQLRRGQNVEVVVRRVTEPNTEGVIPYGLKARPIGR
jgi:uncharacterized OB-fold protein